MTQKLAGLPMPRRLYAIIAISFGTALVVIDGTIANVALPTIAHDLGVSGSEAVLVVTIYQLVLVMTMLPFSALGDRIGHRTLYQYGQIAFLCATLLCFFARSLPFLLVVRAVQAIGAAAVLSVSSALIRSIYPSHQLGRGLGISTIIVTSGSALAPTLGGFILAMAPWPWVFAAAIPFALVSLLVGRALPDPKPRDTPYDMVAAALCASTFGLVISGIESAVHGRSPVISAAITLAGVVIGYVFVRRELKSKRPILPLDLLAQPILAFSFAGQLAAFVASMLLLVALPFRLQQVYGFSPGEVGAMIAPWPLTIMVIAPFAGALSDRIPPGLLGGVGMAITVTALLLIAYLPPHPDLVDIGWRMALCGSGFGFYLAPNNRFIIGSAPHERAAAAGGLIATNRLTGQTIGATLAAGLLALGIGTGPAPALVAGVLGLIAGLCSVARLTSKVKLPPSTQLPDL